MLQNNRAPSDGEIEAWISNLTDHQLIGFINTASEFFDDAAKKYLAEELVTQQNRVFQERVLAAVEKGASFKRQLGFALLASIVAPIVLGIVLTALSHYKNFPNIIELLSS